MQTPHFGIIKGVCLPAATSTADTGKFAMRIEFSRSRLLIPSVLLGGKELSDPESPDPLRKPI